MSLRECVALEPLEPADDLIHQSAVLGEVARHWLRLFVDSVLDRPLDLLGKAGSGGRGDPDQRLELGARVIEYLVERGSLGSLFDPLLRALDGALVHLPQGSRAIRMRVAE